MIPIGIDPHSFEPTPADVRRVVGDDVAARQVQLAGLSSVVVPAGATAAYRWSFTIGGVPKQIWLPLVAR